MHIKKRDRIDVVFIVMFITMIMYIGAHCIVSLWVKGYTLPSVMMTGICAGLIHLLLKVFR